MCDKNLIKVEMTFDPEEMARRGRIGAERLHATHNSRELTSPARAAFALKFERQVDPNGMLPPEERTRRAAEARRVYMSEIGRKSGEARRKQRQAASPETQPDKPDIDLQSAQESADSQFLSMRKAADYLGVSRRTISVRIASGVLPAFRDPLNATHFLVRVSDLDQLKIKRRMDIPG